jgi:hypothetical protein
VVVSEDVAALLHRRLGAVSLFHGTALGILLSKLGSKHHWAPREYVFLFLMLFMLGILAFYLQRIGDKIADGAYDQTFWYLATSVVAILFVTSAILISWYEINPVIWLSVIAAWVLSYLFVVFNVKAELDKS